MAANPLPEVNILTVDVNTTSDINVHPGDSITWTNSSNNDVQCAGVAANFPLNNRSWVVPKNSSNTPNGVKGTAPVSAVPYEFTRTPSTAGNGKMIVLTGR